MREPMRRVELSSPSLRLRRAVARNLPALDAQHDGSIRALIERFDDEELRGAVISGIASVPPTDWSADARSLVAERLTGYFEAAPESDFDTVAAVRACRSPTT